MGTFLFVCNHHRMIQAILAVVFLNQHIEKKRQGIGACYPGLQFLNQHIEKKPDHILQPGGGIEDAFRRNSADHLIISGIDDVNVQFLGFIVELKVKFGVKHLGGFVHLIRRLPDSLGGILTRLSFGTDLPLLRFRCQLYRRCAFVDSLLPGPDRSAIYRVTLQAAWHCQSFHCNSLLIPDIIDCNQPTGSILTSPSYLIR